MGPAEFLVWSFLALCALVVFVQIVGIICDHILP